MLTSGNQIDQDFYCESYNQTECTGTDPATSRCSDRVTKKCSKTSPEKVNQCFVVWTNISGKVGKSIIVYYVLRHSRFIETEDEITFP